MGWSTGSGIAESLWTKLRRFIKPEDYKKVSKLILDTFTEYDADDWQVYPSDDCLMYVYMKFYEPEELAEYDLDSYFDNDEEEEEDFD